LPFRKTSASHLKYECLNVNNVNTTWVLFPSLTDKCPPDTQLALHHTLTIMTVSEGSEKKIFCDYNHYEV